MKPWLVAWLIAVGVLSVLDIQSTFLCLSVPGGGITEANPLLAWLIDAFGITVGLLIIGTLVKLTGIVISALFLNWAFKEIAKVGSCSARAFVNGLISALMVTYFLVLLLVVCNNYRLFIHSLH